MSKVWLNLKMFTMNFGKIKCPTTEHLLKVTEEYNELLETYTKYQYLVHSQSEDKTVNTKDSLSRFNLCDEALDMVQASISFVSHLIDSEQMDKADIQAWFKKLQKRKKKYLSRGGNDGKKY